MKVRDVVKELLADGWYLHRQAGSHRQFKHPDKPGKVTVAGHPNTDMPPETLARVREQAGLERGR